MCGGADNGRPYYPRKVRREFTRDNREVEHQVARDGERALKMALLLLAALNELRDGDTLKCTEEST